MFDQYLKLYYNTQLCNMHLPITLNVNTIKIYNNYDNQKDRKTTLQSDNFLWNENVPKNLQELCIQAIAENWEESPLLDEITETIDRCHLLDILPTNLPLGLTVPKIPDDVYWKRCYLRRWPKLLPVNVELEPDVVGIVGNVPNSRKQSNGSVRSRKSSVGLDGRKTWKSCFLEMHARDYLEKLKPEEYNAEKMKELADLCGGHVRVIIIREMQCAEDTANRIPLNSIITGFKYLNELSISFKQKYVGVDKFTWDILNLPLQEIKLLAKGLEKCNLSVFRVKNSDINDDKAVILLKALLRHGNFKILDFSHCRLGDRAAVAISKFCLQNPVEELILANNRIGHEGVEALCYAICQASCNVEVIDLKMNDIGRKGGDMLMKALTIGAKKTKTLCLSACGLNQDNTSIGEMLESNTSLVSLDLANNKLGEKIGRIIRSVLSYNITLTKLDLRMCNLGLKMEFEILDKINKNRTASRQSQYVVKPSIVEPLVDFEVSEDLLWKIENIFDSPSQPEPQIEAPTLIPDPDPDIQEIPDVSPSPVTDDMLKSE